MFDVVFESLDLQVSPSLQILVTLVHQLQTFRHLVGPLLYTNNKCHVLLCSLGHSTVETQK